MLGLHYKIIGYLKMKNNNLEQLNSRRSFMKKAAYSVPTIIAISQLTNPTSAEAFKRDTASKVVLVPSHQTTSDIETTPQGISGRSAFSSDN